MSVSVCLCVSVCNLLDQQVSTVSMKSYLPCCNKNLCLSDLLSILWELAFIDNEGHVFIIRISALSFSSTAELIKQHSHCTFFFSWKASGKAKHQFWSVQAVQHGINLPDTLRKLYYQTKYWEFVTIWNSVLRICITALICLIPVLNTSRYKASFKKLLSRFQLITLLWPMWWPGVLSELQLYYSIVSPGKLLCFLTLLNILKIQAPTTFLSVGRFLETYYFHC